MNFEPEKFFIGLVDFFSIFLPGAVLAYVIKDQAVSTFVGSVPPINGVEAGLVFLFGSYLLGHLAFLLSALLDEFVYDRVRAWTDWGQITKRLVKGRDLSWRWKRCLAASDWLFGTNADEAVALVERLKARALHALEGERAINAFQWSKARLTQERSEGLLAVQRFEADSKFFRSFVVVLLVLALIYAHRVQQDYRWVLAALLCLLGTVPALWRYVELRFKATQQAYWLVLTLEASKGPVTTPVARPDGLTHAGGVVFQGKGAATKFILISPTKNKKRRERLLPKGHIEPGEDPRVTAVREVREETGHLAKVFDWLNDLPLNKQNPDAGLVRWFLLELSEEKKDKDWRPEDRVRDWFTYPRAKAETKFEEVKDVLDLAAKKLKLEPAPDENLTRRT